MTKKRKNPKTKRKNARNAARKKAAPVVVVTTPTASAAPVVVAAPPPPKKKREKSQFPMIRAKKGTRLTDDQRAQNYYNFLRRIGGYDYGSRGNKSSKTSQKKVTIKLSNGKGKRPTTYRYDRVNKKWYKKVKKVVYQEKPLEFAPRGLTRRAIRPT